MESKIKTYRDLIVWQKSMNLVTRVYQIAKQFPKEELYGLVAQLCRSSVSIPSNIAEGYGRRSTSDYMRFLQIAMSSGFELQTQLQIALNLKYMTQSQFDEIFELSREVERMLSGLIRKIEK